MSVDGALSNTFVLPRRRQFTWADLIGPIATGTVVMAVFLWLWHQGLESLTTFDTALGSLGLLTGLLASDLMLVQVVMLARIPWVERAWGHDLLARRHKWIGYASFWLLVAHIAFFAGQRLNRSGGWDGAAMWELFIHESWLLAATIGTVMVIIVVAASVKVARRTLRYESWHLLHLYAYLGLALALPHQIYDGSDFHGAFSQLYWWTIYAVAAAAVLIYRVALPIGRSLYHGIRVVEVVRESPRVVSVHVKGRRLDRLHTQSGQFFIWRFLDGPGWSRANPYTISAAPTNDRLRVTIQSAGDGSSRAAQLKPGTPVFLEGPYGSMTARHRTQQRVLLLAAGVGITPIRALLEDTPYLPGEAILLYRFHDTADAIFIDEIHDLAQRRGVEVHYLSGPRRAPDSWLPATVYDGRPGSLPADDAAALKRLVPDVADRDLFVCGPLPWLRAVTKAARATGVPRHHIHSEDFAW